MHRQQFEKDKQNVDVAPPGKISADADGGCPTFSDRVPLVGPVLSARTTLFQENSIFQILLDQKFGKPELTQFRHELSGCEKL